MNCGVAKVMIVEDKAIFSLDTNRLLSSSGFDFKVVDNADDALRQVEREKPDIGLMDVRLKGQLDGVETATIVRGRYNMPVIYVTAKASFDTQKRAEATRPAGHLVKPISQETLTATITTALFNDKRAVGNRPARHLEMF